MPSNIILSCTLPTDVDAGVISLLGGTMLTENESCKRSVNTDCDASVVFFMPHCDLVLYNNLISSNWSAKGLERVVLIGNRSTFTPSTFWKACIPTPLTSTPRPVYLSSPSLSLPLTGIPLFLSLPLPKLELFRIEHGAQIQRGATCGIGADTGASGTCIRGTIASSQGRRRW